MSNQEQKWKKGGKEEKRGLAIIRGDLSFVARDVGPESQESDQSLSLQHTATHVGPESQESDQSLPLQHTATHVGPESQEWDQSLCGKRLVQSQQDVSDLNRVLVGDV